MNTLYIVLDMPPLFGALKLLGKTYSLKQNSLLFLFCWRVCMFVFFLFVLYLFAVLLFWSLMECVLCMSWSRQFQFVVNSYSIRIYIVFSSYSGRIQILESRISLLSCVWGWIFGVVVLARGGGYLRRWGIFGVVVLARGGGYLG